jgi:hypothetical protein
MPFKGASVSLVKVVCDVQDVSNYSDPTKVSQHEGISVRLRVQAKQSPSYTGRHIEV